MRNSRWKGFFIYLFVGILSVAVLYPYQLAMLEEQVSEMGLELPFPVEIAAVINMVNPIALMVIGLLIGVFLAEKAGLTSLVLHGKWSGQFFDGLKKGLKISVISGFLLGVLFKAIDFGLGSSLPEVFQPGSQRLDIWMILSSFLYGGIVEEILLRLGMVTLLVFLFWKLFQKNKAKPSSGVYITAIVVSALLFGLGHYSASAALTEMTPLIWVRMIALNGLGGFVYGLFYWKYNLESAMASHIFTHVGMFTIELVIAFLS